MSKVLLNTKNAADYLGLSTQTLHNWRYKKINLSYSKVGSRILYEMSELERFVNACKVEIS